MSDSEQTPPGFSGFAIDGLERLEDRIIISYGGRIFGGVMTDVLSDEVAAAVRPGAEVLVRYHTAETGRPGHVAHMLIRQPDGGWAELYADWE